MGRLVGLELHNFKSYRGTASIGFGTANFTSIIGPNGAGKSNMMDAISFVLGVRSSHLRSSHLKDLIYRGRIMSKSRDSGDTGASGDETGENENDSEEDSNSHSPDPTRAYVMAIYERTNGDILRLKRTITAAGNSEYRINERIVTVVEYSSVLKRENILIKARNFLVFQGDVEQIASQSPKDLSALVETVSGSVEYKKEYDVLKDEQEKAHENTTSIFSRKRTLNSESKQYKEQLVEAQTFEKKLMDRQNLIKLMNLYKIYHNEKKHNELSTILKNSRKDLKELNKRLATEESALKVISSDYAKTTLSIEKKKKNITKNENMLEIKKRELIPVGIEKSSMNKKIKDYNKKIDEIKNDVTNQTKYVSNVQDQLRVIRKSLNRFKENLIEQSSNDLSPEGIKEYEQLRQEYLSKEGANLEESLDLLKTEKDSILTQLSTFENQKDNSQNRINELLAQITSCKIQYNDATSNLNESNETLSNLIKDLNEIKVKKEEINLKEIELNSRLRDVLVDLDELTANQRETNRERKLRENVSTLRRLIPGVKGLVHDLCRPTQKKYELAVSTILGKNFDSIVVENLSVAHKCIDYLKEQRAGVASFIPLDSVDSKPPQQYLRSVHNQARPALDVIDFEPFLEKAMQYVVSNAMIADNMDVARYIKWERNIDVKVVTLDGSLIHKAGLMTGGKTKNQEKRWDKNEAHSLTLLKEDLQLKISELKNLKPKEIEANEILDKIHNIENQIPSIRNNKSNLERQIKDRKSEIKYQEDLIEEFEERKVEKGKYLSLIDSKISKIEMSISVLQDSIYSDFCKKHSFNNGINDYEQKHGSMLRSRAKEESKFEKQISSLENKLIFEKERLAETSKRLRKLETDKGNFEKKLSLLIENKGTLESEIDHIESEIEISKTEFKEFEKESSKILRLNKNMENQFNELTSDIKEKQKKITDDEEILEQTDIERVNHLKSCKIESINIPLKDGLLDQLPLSENSESLIKLIYEIEIDYSLLSEKFKDNLYSKKIEVEFEEKLALINQELEQLTPNSKAINRLNEVEGKLKEFDRDFTRARQQENKVIEKFNNLKERRYQRFIEAYNHISNKIDDIYKELTKSSASPLGGSAFLTLEDEDEPYNSGIKYHAMPPMKRFRDMEFLSGGEKTIAALALLFAIHSYQPSPFFVLDEVDAALDNSNVNKIANYIKNYAGPNFQFIVISLKNSLFEKSDSLVGIYREQKENSSKTLTLDLRNYPEEEMN